MKRIELVPTPELVDLQPGDLLQVVDWRSNALILELVYRPLPMSGGTGLPIATEQPPDLGVHVEDATRIADKLG